MNRPFLLVAFAFLLVSIPVFAQHGGGHASGGHGGMSAHAGSAGHGFSGHSGSHGFSGGHAGSGFSSRSFSHRSSNQFMGSRGFNHFRGGPLRTFGFRNCRGFGCRGLFGYGYGYPWYGSPWSYGGSFDPSWWWDSGSSYDPDREREMGIANEMNQQSLDEQRMREQSEQDIYEPAAPRRPRTEQSSEAVPATVLVFRDQRKKEVENYAIVGQTLWNFSAQHTEKIPLSDLDLAATEKANGDRGVDFRVPGAHEGQ